MEHEVTKQSDRFELTVSGTTAGFAQFVDHEGSRIFYHTEVYPQFGGKGLATALVEESLEATREEGLRIVPVCPFVTKHVEDDSEAWSEHVDRPTPDMLRAIPKEN